MDRPAIVKLKTVFAHFYETKANHLCVAVVTFYKVNEQVPVVLT